MLHNLSLQQLANVPTHRRGHTLDWLITNRVVVAEELCVVDKLILDHFVISLALRFRKPGKTTKEVRSRNVRALNTDNFKTDVLSAFPAVSGAADAVSAFNACLRELLDKHASLVTRRLTDRMSAPWMTQEIKQAKQQRPYDERQWHKTSLEIHRQIYAHCCSVVNQQIRNAKKQFLCEKIVSAISFKELFRLSGQMMGSSMNSVLPGNISPVNLPSKFNDFFAEKIETIRSNLDSTPRRADSVVFVLFFRFFLVFRLKLSMPSVQNTFRK